MQAVSPGDHKKKKELSEKELISFRSIQIVHPLYKQENM